MAPTAALLFSRRLENCTFTEDGYIDENSCDVPFWSSRTGAIVKWSLFLGLIVIVGLYLLIGYVHAQRRIQKGLPPLGYHRFLVSRSVLARVDPRYRPPQPANVYPYHPDAQYYDMHAVPPPVYDPNAPRPPMYEPPSGATKINSNQQQPSSGPSQEQNEEGVEYGPPPGSPPPSSSRLRDTYAPPPGPPPSAVRPQGTGNTNPFRD
ncbi:hypothetical protein NEMBOFW57_002530 [Staphylotrichum longicolle]|uniref:Uncharacterized protein n=1 Tax=Staphylotrichum longicolle TaxID=669026 RepID=A0AAD4F3Y8_9PEZI|nr:hypothetical protein NEMBOFW57_002530 [Staphylotrichum longicolle]